MSAKEHVAEILRTMFSIEEEPDPLTEDLHHDVKNLSADELYDEDVHILLELIKNAEDNEYPEGVDPSLEFAITSKEVTNTGAPAISLVFNNEKGVFITVDVTNLVNAFIKASGTHPSNRKLMKRVPDYIKANLMNKALVLCDSLTSQNLFRKPHEVYKLHPSFRSILNAAKSQHVSFNTASTIFSQEVFFITSALEGTEYYSIHNFLEIRDVDPIWYVQCISGSNIVMGVSEDVYLQLLVFISQYFSHCSYFKNIPLIKYTGLDGNVELFKINDVSAASRSRKLLSGTSGCISWLNQWNAKFSSSTCPFFLSEFIQVECNKNYRLKKWLMDVVKVKFVSVYEYADYSTL